MNEHGENERLVPFHYSVCRFLFLCVHNKEQTNAESGTHRSQRRINKWNEEQRERESQRTSQPELPYSICVGYNFCARLASSSVAACFVRLVSFFPAVRSMIHSKSFVNSCIRWILWNFVVFFFHVFVFLLFSQSWTARKWFSNPDDCRPNWKKRIISSRMNFAIILFYFWFLCLCFALCCVLGELPLYFSVDFLVSLRSQNMTMSRICPATHTRI